MSGHRYIVNGFPNNEQRSSASSAVLLVDSKKQAPTFVSACMKRYLSLAEYEITSSTARKVIQIA